MPKNPHFHVCNRYCSPSDPTRVDPAADARTALADEIAIACAARATDAQSETARNVWWDAARLARQIGDADVPR